MRTAFLFGLLTLLVAASRAETPALADPAPAAPIAALEAIVVTGEQPGPGLWRVSKGDHVLWILGTLSPLPKRMQWISREVVATIAEAQEVLASPSIAIKADIGWIRGAFLLPSLLGARKNPGDAKLVDVVPAELHARWLVLKKKYMGRNESIERRRPIFASQKLYEKAIKRAGMSGDNVVAPVVAKAAKKYGVPVTRPQIEVKFEEPKAAIREFAKTSLDDIDCFQKTLERLESDLETMRERGNAWATGDIEALQKLPVTDQYQACSDALLNANFAQSRGLDDLRARMAEAWLVAAEAALAKNKVSFATLPMAQILNPDGYVANLKAKGYEVEAP